jgi:hypothetical protein
MKYQYKQCKVTKKSPEPPHPGICGLQIMTPPGAYEMGKVERRGI